MVPDYDQIAETETGQLEFFDADGNSLGVFDTLKDFEEWRDGENGREEAGTQGSGSEGATREASGDNASADSGESDTAGTADFGGSSGGDFGSGDEQAGDTEGVADEAGNSVTVENWPTDYATSAQLETVTSDLVVVQDHLEVMSASMVVLVVLVAACVGVSAVRTLLKSFEGY